MAIELYYVGSPYEEASKNDEKSINNVTYNGVCGIFYLLPTTFQ